MERPKHYAVINKKQALALAHTPVALGSWDKHTHRKVIKNLTEMASLPDGIITEASSKALDSIPALAPASLSPLSKLEIEPMGLAPQNDVSICFVPGEPPERIVDSELTELLDVRPPMAPGSAVFPTSTVAAIAPAAAAAAAPDDNRLVLSIGSLKSEALASIMRIFRCGS